MSKIAIPFQCPKCGAKPQKHGSGACQDNPNDCEGFICECGDYLDNLVAVEKEDHGETFSNPCHFAHCYHCGWGGTFPKKPKGLLPWEKKALEAGWTPSEARKKELKL